MVHIQNVQVPLVKLNMDLFRRYHESFFPHHSKMKLVQSVVEMMRWGMFRLIFLWLIFCTQELFVTAENKYEHLTESTQIDGCSQCGAYRCPEDPKKCLLGSVPDPCECCKDGICAKLIGEACWNASISDLPPKRRDHGFCATNYECKSRSDLEPEQDEPEAICVCKDQSVVCGSNNQTYSTLCELNEEAMRMNNPLLRLQHTGPCPSRPWIISAPENVLTGFGQRVALNCESKGFPVPEIFWEFRSADGVKVLKLPSKELEAVVNTRDGPESFMRTSWVLLARLQKEHVGTYYCIANNSIGESSTSSFITLKDL